MGLIKDLSPDSQAPSPDTWAPRFSVADIYASTTAEGPLQHPPGWTPEHHFGAGGQSCRCCRVEKASPGRQHDLFEGAVGLSFLTCTL